MSSWKKQYAELSKHLVKFSKAYKSDFAKATKSRKTGNSGKGGFNKEVPVPEVLTSFLELDKSVTLPRPKVSSAMHNKFNELKLKDGQKITIDKSTFKALKLTEKFLKDLKNKSNESIVTCNDDGTYMLQQKHFSTFLAAFYPKKVEVEVVV